MLWDFFHFFFQLQTLQSENSSLRRQATTNIYQVQSGSEYTDPTNNSSLKRRPSARGSRPMSMYETGSAQKPYLPMAEVTYPEESITRLQPFPPHVSKNTDASVFLPMFSFSASSNYSHFPELLNCLLQSEFELKQLFMFAVLTCLQEKKL